MSDGNGIVLATTTKKPHAIALGLTPVVTDPLGDSPGFFFRPNHEETPRYRVGAHDCDLTGNSKVLNFRMSIMDKRLWTDGC